MGAAFGRLGAGSADLGVAGVRRTGEAAAIQRDDLFLLGSNAKAMTAAVAARLVERGAIGWTTALTEALPDMAAAMHPAYCEVTLEQLLNHRGGVLGMNQAQHLERFFSHLQAHAGALPDSLEGRKRFFATSLLALEPEAGVTPGTSYVYSNAGYALAAMMLERASGLPLDKLLDEEVSRPLGVPVHWVRGDTPSSRGPTGHAGVQGRAPQAIAPIRVDEADWAEVLRPAGPDPALTPMAYAEWMRWHLKALQGQATPLASSYVQRLKALRSDDYALGWAEGRLHDGCTVLVHSGEWGGFASQSVLLQTGEGGGFAMTNVVDAVSGTGDDSWVFQVLRSRLRALQAQQGANSP